jgi:hypothetical protein
MENIRDDPLSITSVGITFTLASEQNIKYLVHKNEEKDEKIKEMEEEVRHSKSDRESIREFRLCTEKVRKEIHKMVVDMYEICKFSNN